MGVVEKEKCNFPFKPRIMDHEIFDTFLLFVRKGNFIFFCGKVNKTFVFM